MNNLVSIIMPLYNGAKTVRDSILSVQKQSYINWELIIIDDYSTDESNLIVKAIARNDSRIIILDCDKNMGVSHARNIGIEKAQGNFIAFLDSDDLWDASKLELQISFMKRHNYPLTYTSYRKVNKYGNEICSRILVPKSLNYAMLLKHNQIACLTAIYNVRMIGKYYFKKIGHEDYVYWLDMLRSGLIAYGIPDVLASYRQDSNSLSGNKLKAASYTWTIYRKYEKFHILKSIYFFSHYALKTLVKYLKS